MLGRGRWLIVLTFVLALVLSIWPLPEWAMSGRPAWVAVMVVFWVMMVPHRVGIATAFVCGLLLDVLTGSVIGEHALALTVVAFLTYRLHVRLRTFAIAQQCVAVLILIGLYQLMCRLVQGAMETVPITLVYWLPSLTSALLWPWLVWFLNGIRLRFRAT